MSYKGFKRLLGESSLERKSRFLLGAVTLLLISGSFWLYARMTASLAYDATQNAGRLLTAQALFDFHLKSKDPKAREALEEFQQRAESIWKNELLSHYKVSLIKPQSNLGEFKTPPEDREIIERLKNFAELNEDTKLEQDKFYYYGAIHVTQKCLNCHPYEAEKAELKVLKEGQLYAVVRIQLDSAVIEEGTNLSRAVLISSALITSLLIMAATYLIIRYVVVKPVKHLKEVSDSIASGYYNVRSEIQTGDEFEDLSLAFNRMIRNLLTKQEELNEAKTNLDVKVDELARANLALFESNKLKGDFLATMSHELRTPLHSILGFSDLLQQGDKISDKQQRWVRNIRSSGAHLLDIINDILDLAKIEAGKMEIKPVTFSVNDLVERVALSIRPLAAKKNIDVKTLVAEDLPTVRQDAGKLEQILSNLMSNAVKFTPEEGKVLVRAGVEGDELVLTVNDTGVGIPVSDQAAVFEKFRQGANPLTREYAGTGLGLSITRELANLLGGDVSLQSEPGKGSSFTVRIPISAA
jgi:signal transduction histidine kinase